MDFDLFIDTQSCQRNDMQGGSFITTLQNEMLEAQRLMTEQAIEHHYYYQRAWNEKRMLVQMKTAHNMRRGNHAQHRFYNVHYSRFPAVKMKLKEIALAFHANDSTEICSLLNDLRSYERNFANSVRNRLNDTNSLNDTIEHCYDCGTFITHDDGRMSSEDELICDRCISNEYTYSECMDTYIHSNNQMSVYHSVRAWRNECSDDVCTQRYGDRNFHEYNNEFFSDSDDCYDARDENGDGDEDERERSVNYLAGWHGTSRNFIDKNVSKKYPSLGAELEIYVPERDDFVGETRGEFGTDLILESDGSLCSKHGIEMITHPLGREEWSEFAPRWFEHIQSLDGIGYNEPAGEKYGIHLTIHRDNLSPLAEARIAMFLSSTDNGDFVRAVSQRAQIYSPSNDIGIGQMTVARIGCISREQESRFNVLRNQSQTKIVGRGKFCPVNFKADLAEFRIFQSTTNLESFQKNLEFVWALWAWTKTETASGNSHSYKDFVMWLNKRQQRQEFPVLIKFLSKRMFYGTNFAPLISPWHGLMTKPTQDSAVESMAA